MVDVKSKQTKKYLAFFKKLPQSVGERMFLSILVSFLAAAVVGTVVFYRYAVQIPETELHTEKEVIVFHKDALRDLTEKWRERAEKFESALQKERPDFFQ